MDGYEMTMAVEVRDADLYQEYRRRIGPLLDAVGGAFRFDCEVARVMGGGAAGLNRLFILAFPSREAKERFFADPSYVELRRTLFARSVARFTILAEYEVARARRPDRV